MRLSYVIWQEAVAPIVVVELLSPGTENEDLGRFATTHEPAVEANTPPMPPPKWQVYEQILRVPYYIVFNRYTDQMRAFTLSTDQYQEQPLTESQVWIPELDIGLGLWQGEYEGVPRQWLRWYDAGDHWIATDTDKERQRAEQRADQAKQQLEDLLARLRVQGIDPESL